MTTIAYAKFGRSIGFDPGKYGFQGDAEAPNLLIRLARRNPDVTWLLIGKHGPIEMELPPNIVDPWPKDLPRGFWHHEGGVYRCSHCKTPLDPETIVPDCCEKAHAIGLAELNLIALGEQCDGMVVHIGQHGTTNHPLPEVKNRGKLTLPQVWSRNLGGYMMKAVNAMHLRTDGNAPVVWICTDPRNYMKARDVAWPTGLDRVLAQYTFSRPATHERYGDERTPTELGIEGTLTNGLMKVTHTYRHAGLELMILPDDWETWGQKDYDDRDLIGVATTSSWVDDPGSRRSRLILDYVFRQYPDAAVYGKWDEKSLAEVEGYEVIRNKTTEFVDILGAYRATVVMPPVARHADGVKWTTAKPYQAFAARTAAFFLGPMDAQGWIIPATRQERGTVEVAEGLWSIRSDWTAEDIVLARWLRVGSPADLKSRVDRIANEPDTWRWIVNQQRDLLQRRWDEKYTERCIEHQLGI